MQTEQIPTSCLPGTPSKMNSGSAHAVHKLVVEHPLPGNRETSPTAVYINSEISVHSEAVFPLVSYTSTVRKGIHEVLSNKWFLNQQLNQSSYVAMLRSVGINEHCSTFLAVISF